MGIYTNMEMPENGSCIQIVIDDDGKVYPSVEKCILKMGSIANAVPVPPHGDLIDRRYTIATACSGRIRALPTTEDGEDWIRVEEVRESIKNAPTVIPAELQKEE